MSDDDAVHDESGGDAPAGDAPAALSPRAVVVSVAGLVTSALLLVMSLIPAPYVVQSPGPTVDTLGTADGEPLIEVAGASTYPTGGALRLTTVSVRGGPGTAIDPMTVIGGWLRSSSSVVPVEVVFPDAVSEADREQRSAAEMTTSQENATAAALTALGHDVPAVLTVAGIIPESGSDGALEVDDVLLAVGGVELASFQDLADVLASTPPGTEIAVAVRRDGERREPTVVTGDDGQGGSVLGVFVDPDFDFPVDVTIRIEEIGGPSAGSMFALGIVDTLTPGELTGGVDIAGTGTISIDGDIGAIGGIRQKVAGAARDGSAFFLAPTSNCAEVLGHVPGGLTVVPVGSLDEALDAVAAIAEGRVGDLATCDAA